MHIYEESGRRVDRRFWIEKSWFDRQFWSSQFQLHRMIQLQPRNTYGVCLADAGYLFPHTREYLSLCFVFYFLFEELSCAASPQSSTERWHIDDLIINSFYNSIVACYHLSFQSGVCKDIHMFDDMHKICRSIFEISWVIYI